VEKRRTTARPRFELATALQSAFHRPGFRATPGLVTKLSGVPRGTIVNWLDGRVTRPRRWQDLVRVADALRLAEVETDFVLAAAGHVSIERLFEEVQSGPDRALLAAWERPNLIGSPKRANQVTGLPAQLTSLIGRDVELADLGVRIRAGGRLTSLIGTGGVGKSQLALALAHLCAPEFPDGIAWIPLAGVVDPARMELAVAAAVGVRESDPAVVAALLASALESKRILLVIDNFEQLLPAAAQLVALLEGTKHVQMLVTSRAPLRVGCEHEFRVAPLEVPRIDHLPSLAELERIAAVKLFVSRAQTVNAQFRLDEHNAAVVAEICAHLDGLPLALELAAARLNLLTPHALLPRLRHRLSLLTNGKRDSTKRHQTLRNTIGWSYTLLPEDEQWFFRQLAVFVGGIGLTVAEGVWYASHSYDSEQPNAVLDSLAALVDQSLLSAQPAQSPDTEPRFMMLETIREYALEAVTARDERDSAHAVHAEGFLTLAERSDASFSTEPTATWLEWFRREYENLRAALSWCIAEKHNAAIGARLAAALGRYWFERGLFSESRDWFVQTLAIAGNDADAATLAKVRLYLAFSANYGGDYAAGEKNAAEARDAYRLDGNEVGAAHACNALGVAAMYSGRFDQAETLFERALGTYRALGAVRDVAVALHNLGEIAADHHCNFAGARRRYAESLDIFRQLQHAMNVGCTLGLLAELATYEADGARAIGFSREALQIHISLENQPLIGEELARLARCELLRGHVADAERFLRRALPYLDATLNARHLARFLESLAEYALAKDDPRAGRLFLGFSERIRNEYGLPRSNAARHQHAQLAGKMRANRGRWDDAAIARNGMRLTVQEMLREAEAFIAATPEPEIATELRADGLHAVAYP